MGSTSIPVSEAVADELYALKGRTESYDEKLRDLLDMNETAAEAES